MGLEFMCSTFHVIIQQTSDVAFVAAAESSHLRQQFSWVFFSLQLIRFQLCYYYFFSTHFGNLKNKEAHVSFCFALSVSVLCNLS